jgi:hypothetical protein
MAFEQKPGTGALFKNAPKGGKKEGSPDYKGFLMLPDGSIVGLALWEKETKGGTVILSLAVDDREGEYHAKKNGARQVTKDDTQRKADPAAREFGRGASDRESAGFGRGERGESGFSSRVEQDDFDDEIPF